MPNPTFLERLNLLMRQAIDGTRTETDPTPMKFVGDA